MRAPGHRLDFIASAADTLKGGHPAPYGVPALAGTVLPLEGGSIRCEIQNEVACDRLKPGLHSLHKTTPVVESCPFSFRDQIFELKPGLRAFTLLELLIVLAIIGFLSAMALPHLRTLTRSNIMAGANEQLLGDLALARQRAINSRSAVYVVFMPQIDPMAFNFLTKTQLNQTLTWQYTSYTLFAERSVGDQPGRPFKRYLTGWKSLPDGVFIATNKFSITNSFPLNGAIKQVLPFDYGNFPYPTSDSVNTPTLAYIKFDAQGKLVSSASTVDGTCIIPLARGSILVYTDPSGQVQVSDPVERPANNSTDTNTYNHIEIDAATGRAHLDRRSL